LETLKCERVYTCLILVVICARLNISLSGNVMCRSDEVDDVVKRLLVYHGSDEVDDVVKRLLVYHGCQEVKATT